MGNWNPQVYTGSAPAAGAEHDFKFADQNVSHSEPIMIQSLMVTLTASAQAANRVVHFDFYTPSGVKFYSVRNLSNIVASDVVDITAASGLYNSETVGTHENVVLPKGFVVPADTEIKTVVENIDVGDQLSDLQIVCYPNGHFPDLD